MYGSFPNPKPRPLFYWGGFMVGLSKPQLLTKFEVTGFIYYGNIKEFVFKRQIHFLSHPLGMLIGKRVVDFLIIELFR